MRVPVAAASLVFVLAAGCGGGPTAPRPAPITQAFLQDSGQWSWGHCLGDLGCYFLTSIHNVGPSCASGTSVVVRFYNVNNAQRDAQMGVGPPGLLSALIIRPNEIVAISSLSPQDTFASYRVFPTWNNVACP